ncbi:putative histone H2AXa [Morus notabilis]|uniref:Putative histone H2AXa n=1 Tax=Morus notabilis TaxID=981085 RepID=W9SR71_9ROSA|nr:probable histone H2AXa [Morus notabilis]EXC21536.1 putative histone H2AXa [Morus notabilis]
MSLSAGRRESLRSEYIVTIFFPSPLPLPPPIKPPLPLLCLQDGGSTKHSRGKPKASKSVLKFQKAGLQFPDGCIACFLKEGKYAERVGAGAPVYLSAILEYLAT